MSNFLGFNLFLFHCGGATRRVAPTGTLFVVIVRHIDKG